MKIFSIVRVKGQKQQIAILRPASVDYLNLYYLGYDARKPVFGGLRTTKAQISLRIRAV